MPVMMLPSMKLAVNFYDINLYDNVYIFEIQLPELS